jgi:hypothetical protein
LRGGLSPHAPTNLLGDLPEGLRGVVDLGSDLRRIRRMHVLSDFFAAFLLRQRNVILPLQVDPELRAVAEVAAQAQCRIRTDRAAAVQNIGDAARGNAKQDSEAIGAEIADSVERLLFGLSDPLRVNATAIEVVLSRRIALALAAGTEPTYGS